MSNIDDLEKLAELKKKGILTKEEFETQKEAILAAGQSVATNGGEPKSRLIYILLALFAGSLGIHNFYAGYNGKAITQLLLCLLLFWLIIPLLIVFVWVLVDIVTVTKDAKGVPFN